MSNTNNHNRPGGSSSSEQARLVVLSDLACMRIDEVFARLGVRFNRSGRCYQGVCPIHQGADNQTALRFYDTGLTKNGHWTCETRKCETKWSPTLIGFVRGTLSHQQGRDVGMAAAVQWVCETLKVSLKDIKIDLSEVEKRRWSSRIESLISGVETVKQGWSRAAVRKNLVMPCEYYLERGFGEGILDSYDIGTPLHSRPDSPMFNRVVVPVYDNEGKFAVGFTGRSLEENPAIKWRNHGFSSSSTLFNWWKCRDAVRRLRSAVLVEGPGDCVRGVEAGIPNILGTFGVALHDAQQVLLESAGVMDLILLYDTDTAGEGAIDLVRKRVGRGCRLHIPDWKPQSGKDLGGASLQEIRSGLFPLIGRWCGD